MESKDVPDEQVAFDLERNFSLELRINLLLDLFFELTQRSVSPFNRKIK